MHTLKIQESEFDHRHPIEIRLTLTHNGLSQSASAYLAPLAIEADYRLQRWYFEDFRVYQTDSELTLAQIALDRMAKTGVELFRQVFLSSQETRALWAQASSVLPDVRVELEEANPGVRLFPWELLRANSETAPIVLTAAAFVFRTSRSTGYDAPANTASSGLREPERERILGPERPYRALLVICRPFGFSDVEFRAVARPLLAIFEKQGFSEVTFDVLRPPTFKRLCDVLLAANQAGRPYHIVHFDGHGIRLPSRPRCYLAFEPEVAGSGPIPVPGDKLGAALNAGAVQLMIMNACRSAYAQHMSDAGIAGELSDTPDTTTPIAYEVASASPGTAGVVAMRYNVAVETATRFVVKLYEEIGSGGELARIVSEARRLLASTGWPGALAEAWQLPVFVQNHPLRSLKDHVPQTRASEGSSERHRKPRLEGVLRSQDGGIVGQDYALLELDRTFGSRKIVMLFGPPGSGKTALAMEFAQWLAQTGGLADSRDSRAAPVIFYRDLCAFESVDKLCESIRHALPGAADVALSVEQLVNELAQQETLIILDVNNDDIPKRQTILPEKVAAFVRLLIDRGIKVLFVARHLASLALSDFLAFQLRYVHSTPSYAIAAKWLAQRGVDDYDLLSRVASISGGLPGVIRWIADRSAAIAETEKISPARALRTLVEKLQDERILEPGIVPANYNDLWFSINDKYTASERRDLSLIALFQGFFQRTTLQNVKLDLDDLPIEATINSSQYWDALLQRAEQHCLLHSWGSGGYAIHPFAKSILIRWFEEHFGAFEQLASSDSGKTVLEAFVDAAVRLGDFLQSRANQGLLSTIHAFRIEKPNLVRAFEYALIIRDRNSLVELLFPLKIQSQSDKSSTEWLSMFMRVRDLLDSAEPDDARSLPLVTRAVWARLKLSAPEPLTEDHYRDYFELCERWVEPVKSKLPGHWSRDDKLAVYHYLTAIMECAPMLFRSDREILKEKLIEAKDFAISLSNPRLHASALLQLAMLHYGAPPQDDPLSGDLEAAERCLNEVLALHYDGDVPYHAECHLHLGDVYIKRFYRSIGKKDLLRSELYLDVARDNLLRAAAYCNRPAASLGNFVKSRVYEELGFVSRGLRDVDGVEQYFRVSISLSEEMGDRYNAAKGYRNFGVALADCGSRELGKFYLLESRRKFIELRNEGDSRALSEIDLCAEFYRSFIGGEMPSING